jgi:hypothetical protein
LQGRVDFLPAWRTMGSPNNQRKCRCCNVFFTPDCHNPNRQFYCSAPDCRRASKAASQRRWLQKPANRNYFRDAQNVQRVQQWRKANPGYWKRAKSRSKQAQTTSNQPFNPETTSCNAPEPELRALQDFVLVDHPAFVGLLSLVTGSTLQEDIAAIGRNVLLQGRNILGLQNPESIPSNHDP